PACRILLVEASSTSDDDLFRAVDEAVALGAGYVSNSWGDPDFAGRPGDDAHFDHAGVAITASTGDSGAGTQYPATSRYVTAVGGTSLRRSSSGRGWTETAWSGAGSGCATGETRPSWQSVTTGCSGRAEADVAAVADPRTGVAVYQTYGEGGWVTYGGTSVAAPLIAAVYALAGTPSAGTYPASYPYLTSTRLFDVTSGTNGGCGGAICTARTGWDGPTGLGTPDGVAAFTLGGPPSGTCDAAQLLGDPGFESGSTGSWVMSSRVLNDTDLQPPHGGSWDAWLDGYGSTHVDTLEQTVTVPAGCAATLSFYLHVSTEESTTTAANDSLAVDVDGHTVVTYSNLDHQPGYTQHTIPLPDATGPTTVTFTGSENDSLATGFIIDDAELTVR
ncbi:MAG TPA: S8 family serine peptidase, partial [Micromonosporaceae bacterium]